MRDKPLVLNVPWGKKKARLFAYKECIEKRRVRRELKREEPRGNGARNREKT
jgi:hypothetical protein